MIVTGYEMHLYCDGPCQKPGNQYSGTRAEFSGRDRRDVLRSAIVEGWKIRGMVALCPKCTALPPKENKR